MSDFNTKNYITLKVPDGLIQIPIYKISHFLFEDGRTKLIYDDGNQRVLSETMKDLEILCKGYGFIRIHQRCIVKLGQELNFIVKSRIIILSNNCKLIVAKDRVQFVKQELLNK